jgi:hypothetical protein
MRRTASAALAVFGLAACDDAMQPDPRADLADGAQASATTRPIEEFVGAQGAFCLPDGSGGCFLFVPPVANFTGWDNGGEVPPEETRGASVDYAGLANAWIEGASGGAVSFGTTFDGTITERPLADGRVAVQVQLHTQNALAWAIAADEQGNLDFGSSTLLFGHRAPEVLAGAEPALVESVLQLRFINTGPGVPIPDLLQLFFAPEPGQEVTFLSFHAHGSGPLQAAFGVLDGTPGRLTVTQTALFKFETLPPGSDDNFPAERVELQAIGH